MRRRIVYLIPVLLGAALSGCSNDGASEAEGEERALYRAAMHEARQCMVDLGYTVTDVFEMNDEFGFNVTVPEGISEEDDILLSQNYIGCLESANVDEFAAAVPNRHLTGAERDRAMASLITCLEHYGVTGLDPTATDSRVFLTAIDDSASDPADASLCFYAHMDVWPEGDVNNP